MVTTRQRVRRSLFGRRGNRRVRPRATPPGGLPAQGAAPLVAVTGDATVPTLAAPDADDASLGPNGAAKRFLAAAGRALRSSLPALRSALRAAGLVALAAALGVGAWLLCRSIVTSPHFAVREIVTPAFVRVGREELLAIADVPPGTSIFRVKVRRIERDLAAHPWLEGVRVRRELPSRLVIEAREREAALLVELSGLYLADREGRVFKRAEPEETADLPVVTGIHREEYLRDRPRAEARLRGALRVLEAYAARPGRPPVGEVHLDEDGGHVLYTRERAAAIRLGEGDLDAKLERFDTVWRLLGPRQRLARAVHLDNRARPDRVTLRLDPEPDAEDRVAER